MTINHVDQELKERRVVRKRLGVSAFSCLLLVLLLATGGLLFDVGLWYAAVATLVMLITFGLFIAVLRYDSKTESLRSERLMESMRILDERVEKFRKWSKHEQN